MTSSSQLRVEMLGGFRVLVDGRAVADAAWTLSRVRALLKLLALAPAPGHHLHRELLMDTLWPQLDPAAAANNLHKVVHLARRGLAGAAGAEAANWLRVANGTVALVPPGGLATDVVEFEANVARARQAPSRASLEDAIAGYTGDLLPDDLYADWAANRRHLLRDTWLALLADLGRLKLDSGDVAAGIATLERLVAVDPLREAAQRALMGAYVEAGEPGRALRGYTQFRDLLRRDLGASPDPETTAVYARLLDAGERGQPAPLGPLAMPPGNLAHELTGLLGREADLRDLRRLLGTARLVTLVGPGGVGKTRLAREAARVSQTAGGSWFIDLAAIADGARAPRAIASALRLQDDPSRDDLDIITDAIAGQSILLVLDNCEHLIDACAATVDRLLRACPAARVLATSREPLGVAGEVTVSVAPLAIPEWRAGVAPEELLNAPSAALFEERARAALPGFRLTDATAPPVVTICAMLEGLPLAIELAAARLRTMRVDQIASQLGNALELLTSGPRTAHPRQQSLRAALDWSYRLLDADERALLRAVALFAGSWSVPAADALWDRPATASTFALLASLAEKSLLVPVGSHDEARYRMLEPIRQWARQLLSEAGERDVAQQRHRAWYVAQVTQRAEPLLWQGGRLDWIGDELGNLRVALESAATHPQAIGDGVRLARAIYSFSEERGWLEFGLNDEARGWLDRLLSDPASDSVPGDALAAALFDAAVLAWRAADFEPARRWLERLLALDPDDPVRRAQYCLGRGTIARDSGSCVDALDWLREGAARAGSVGDRRYLGHNLVALGITLGRTGHHAEAATTLREALEVTLQTRVSTFIAQPLIELAAVEHERGNLEIARGLAADALARYWHGRWNWGIARALSVTARLALHEGDLAQATASWQEAIDRFRAAGERRHLPECLDGLAAVCERDGRETRARDLCAAAASLRAGYSLPSPDAAAIRVGSYRSLPGGAWTFDAVVALVHDL